MKKLFALSLWAVFTAFLLVLGSLTGAPPDQDKPKKKTDRQWCFAWIATPPKDVKERPAMVKAARWPAASVITVPFLDGDKDVQQKVMDNAKKWTKSAGGPANITFDFRRDQNTDVRISFKYEGSWSVIGTTCSK